jgi:hypothetical protein
MRVVLGQCPSVLWTLPSRPTRDLTNSRAEPLEFSPRPHGSHSTLRKVRAHRLLISPFRWQSRSSATFRDATHPRPRPYSHGLAIEIEFLHSVEREFIRVSDQV